MGYFGCSQLIKNYAETILLIDEEYVSQEASYTSQQSSTRVRSTTTCIRENVFGLIVKKRHFYHIKPKVFDWKQFLNNLLNFSEI